MSNPYSKVFYCIYEDDEEVSAEKPVHLSREAVEKLVQRVVKGKDNYIGFIDNQDDTIQAMCDGQDHIWVEVPVEADMGSYGRMMEATEATDVLMSLRAPFKPYINILGLEFESWRE